jgi:flagellar basal-body rod protein FlgB
MFPGQTRFVQGLQGTKMSKTSSIFDFLEAGIRAESLRQKAIANNIANLETPGYRRIDVKFEELLARALNSHGAVELSELEPQIHQPKQTPVNSNGNDVSLESEVGQMVKNTLRFKTYIRLLNKKYNQMQLAMDVK